MSKIEIYEYPLTNKIVSVAVPLILILTTLLLLSLPLWDDSWTIPTTTYILLLLFALPAAAAFALAIHFMYPDIHVRGKQFRLRTLLYESPWLAWSDIRRVRYPETHLTTQLYVVGINGLHPIYWMIGWLQGVFGPGFLIHPRLPRGSRLLRTLIHERPDLFPQPPAARSPASDE